MQVVEKLLEQCIPVFTKGERENAVEREAVGGGVGGDKGHGHEPLEEVNLLRPRQSCPSGHTQRQTKPGHRPRNAVDGYRRRYVHVPESAVHCPAQFLHFFSALKPSSSKPLSYCCFHSLSLSLWLNVRKKMEERGNFTKILFLLFGF